MTEKLSTVAIVCLIGLALGNTPAPAISGAAPLPTPVSVATAAVEAVPEIPAGAAGSSLAAPDGPVSSGAAFEFTDCAAGNCGPVRRVAAAPVRFVGRAFANRPRLLGRVFWRRR